MLCIIPTVPSAFDIGVALSLSPPSLHLLCLFMLIPDEIISICTLVKGTEGFRVLQGYSMLPWCRQASTQKDEGSVARQHTSIHRVGGLYIYVCVVVIV